LPMGSGGLQLWSRPLSSVGFPRGVIAPHNGAPTSLSIFIEKNKRKYFLALSSCTIARIQVVNARRKTRQKLNKFVQNQQIFAGDAEKTVQSTCGNRWKCRGKWVLEDKKGDSEVESPEPENRSSVLQRVPELKVMYRTPTADDLLVASLPIGIIGFNEKAGLDFQIETGLVGEVDADRMITEFCRELDAFNGFAFGLRETHNLAEPISGLLVADRRFSFSSSHLQSSGLRVVRTRSVLTTPGASALFIGEDQAKVQEKNCGKPHKHWEFLCRSKNLCADRGFYAKPQFVACEHCQTFNAEETEEPEEIERESRKRQKTKAKQNPTKRSAEAKGGKTPKRSRNAATFS